MNRKYSIYIRTLGRGGEKYQRLLDSIDSQTIKPEEVVVVLPFGHEPPKERLGYERFAFSEKGMVRQRLFAIDDVKTPYVLLLDDDVEFEAAYVEKMFDTMEKAAAQCCIPILKDSSENPSLLKEYVNRFIGIAAHRRLKDNFFMKINRCGGNIVNTNIQKDKIYYSQTGHGSNCFAESQVLKDIHFEDELWLEELGYALPEDQVMFYKMFTQGYKIAVCQDAYFNHLDAASTNQDGKRYLKIACATAGNFLIFWYKFIYRRDKGAARLLDVLCISHRLCWNSLLYALKCRDIKVLRSSYQGLKFGQNYIESLK